MDSELLLKIFGYLTDYLSALSRTLLRFFVFTTFVETAVCLESNSQAKAAIGGFLIYMQRCCLSAMTS